MKNPNPALIDAVWEHGRVMAEADPAHWRQDSCGAWMRREHYGRQDTPFGWKLEPLDPAGPHDPTNLRPFHWRNGYDPANRRPRCRVSADRTGVPAEKFVFPPRNRDLSRRFSGRAGS
ncbi:MAG: hypothetical protein AB1773_03290 [Pseudomonadota bacterium]